MDLSYASEKFNATVHGIITLPETLTEQAKLEMAVMGTHTLTAKDFPPELKSIFQKWRDDLTRVPHATEGSFHATIMSLSKDEIHTHLRTFYDLYWRVEDAWKEAQPR